MPSRCEPSEDAELDEPIGLAVDTVNNEILVANINSIRVYSRDADGNVAPLRTISGASTGLMNPPVSRWTR